MLNSHPAAQNSAVVGLPHEYWGEAVCGVVITKPDSAVSREELIAFCKVKLTRYKVPKCIDFVSELPLSAVGKVLRREVRRRYREDG